MTHTCSYKQQIDDCDFPLTVEWDIEYSMCSAGPKISDKTISDLMVWLTDDLGVPVRLFDMTLSSRIRVNERIAKMLDDDLLKEACERHWEKFGCHYEDEARVKS